MMQDVFICEVIPSAIAGAPPLLVALTAEGGIVIGRRNGDAFDANVPPISADVAVELARRIIAGDSRALTAPANVLVLSATVVVLNALVPKNGDPGIEASGPVEGALS